MRFQTLEKWLQWQITLHHREIELGLERVLSVWRRLWDGPVPFRVVTVAGTNGKGSSVAFLEAILSSAGYRVGSFTSPHLVRYNERIRVAGEEASDETICRAFDAVDRARGETPLTFFEFSALAALQIFSQSGLDVAVLEVGLGGRLDAVNIIDPDVALITSIGLDHMAWLGGTVDEIALEKAGIMRPGKPAVYAAKFPPSSLLSYAEDLGVKLYLADQDFGYSGGAEEWDWWGPDRRWPGLPRPAMVGDYQLGNASAVLMVLSLLHAAGLSVTGLALRRGLESAVAAARFELVPGPPDTLLDVAHNPHAAAALAGNLSRGSHPGRTLAVFGMMADKDVLGVVQILSTAIDEWYLADLQVPRGMAPADVAKILASAAIDANRIYLHPTPLGAYRAARSAARDQDRIVVFGSFYLVGAVIDQVRSGELV